MLIHVTLKLQGHDEVLWEGCVNVSARCWNGIRPGWYDVDEYDYCWNLLCDAVAQAMPDEYQYDDWYISHWEV